MMTEEDYKEIGSINGEIAELIEQKFLIDRRVHELVQKRMAVKQGSLSAKGFTTQRQEIKNEQFFTNFDTAQRLCDIVKSQPWYADVVRTIEPSAGDGAFLSGIHVDEAYDIDPKHPDVLKQDFLNDESFSVHPLETGKTLSIGNPPFGRMGKQAKQFMRKCAEFSDYIAFILPASFAKKSVIKQLPKNFHLIHQTDLLTESYRFERDGQVVKTVFQIWEKRPELRFDPPRVTVHSDFSFVQAKFPKGTPEEVIAKRPAPMPKGFDLCICTHGSAVGRIYTENFVDKKGIPLSTRTHRFIKSNIGTEELAARLALLDFDSVTKYTTGATCVATSEIVDLYNDAHTN
ncbi:MAG: hypothetical protein HOJ16_06980 [Candidatus Peribacter sp.]|jgi:hypothetical protein|nr:hypothetical protein [Candidatus Peribacter sp.]